VIQSSSSGEMKRTHAAEFSKRLNNVFIQYGSGRRIDWRQIELRGEPVGSLAEGDELTRGMCARSHVARQMYSDQARVA